MVDRFVFRLGIDDRLGQAHWRKGYATEAVCEALEWAKGLFRTGRVLAVAAPENTASLRVAEKCGFRELRRGLSLGRPRVFLERALR